MLAPDSFPFSRLGKKVTVKHVGMLAGGTGLTPMLQAKRLLEGRSRSRRIIDQGFQRGAVWRFLST